MRGGGIGGSAPHESRESPAPPPVPATKLTEALSAEGFGCFQTLETPTAVHSCYRTEDDGTRLVARVVSGQQGTANLVEILAQPPLGIAGQGLPPGDAATPVKEVFAVVGENLFGPAADQLPSFDAGDSRSASLSWGTVSFDLAPEAGTAKFSRAGAPTMPRGADFGAQASAAEGKLAAAGYECDGSGCTGRSQTFDIDAGVTSGEVSMSVMGYDGKPKVTDAELKKHYTDLLRAVADPAALHAAQAWVNEHLKPANGLDQADVGGLHLVVIRTATGDGQLIVTPVLAD